MAAASNGASEPVLLSTFSLAKSCPIHFGPLKDAKTLPCGHAFCFECLKPYAATNRVVCPLCNAVHRVDVYLLPTEQSSSSLGSLIDALPSSADEFLTKSKASATENALKKVESGCDAAIELLDSMKDDFREMKVSFEQKRQSLADELRVFEHQLQADSAGLTEEEKAIESKNLVAICDMFQRVCTMAQDRALHKMLQVSKDVEDVCQRVKNIGLCRYYVDADHELGADREKRVIEYLASLIQRHANSSDYGSLCESMIKEFPRKLCSEYQGVWTAIVGDCSLTWSVPFSLLVQGQTSALKMIVYCCDQPSTKDGSASTHKLGMLASQARFKSIVEIEDTEPRSPEQATLRISRRVQEQFGGKWHCAAGKTDKFIIKSSGDRKFLLKAECQDREYVCWKD